MWRIVKRLPVERQYISNIRDGLLLVQRWRDFQASKKNREVRHFRGRGNLGTVSCSHSSGMPEPSTAQSVSLSTWRSVEEFMSRYLPAPYRKKIRHGTANAL